MKTSPHLHRCKGYKYKKEELQIRLLSEAKVVLMHTRAVRYTFPTSLFYGKDKSAERKKSLI